MPATLGIFLATLALLFTGGVNTVWLIVGGGGAIGPAARALFG